MKNTVKLKKVKGLIAVMICVLLTACNGRKNPEEVSEYEISGKTEDECIEENNTEKEIKIEKGSIEKENVKETKIENESEEWETAKKTNVDKEDTKETSIEELRIENSKTDTDEILNQFIQGEIPANGNGMYHKDIFYITDLPIDVEDFESYHIGDFIDLDNDGENELILEGPYGGMYLDVKGGCVNIFTKGDGTALRLGYVKYENAMWIVYSDTMHSGRENYILEKYNGAENKVDEFALSAEYYESDSYDENSTFLFRDQMISMEEYEELKNQIFGRN